LKKNSDECGKYTVKGKHIGMTTLYCEKHSNTVVRPVPDCISAWFKGRKIVPRAVNYLEGHLTPRVA